jgi:predicted transcriptional regulator
VPKNTRNLAGKIRVEENGSTETITIWNGFISHIKYATKHDQKAFFRTCVLTVKERTFESCEGEY